MLSLNTVIISVMCDIVRFLIIILTFTTVASSKALPANTVNASTFISSQNCSQYISDPKFRLDQFEGNWNYIRYFSSQIKSPKCMTLHSKIEDTKVDITIGLKLSNGDGFSGPDNTEQQTWTHFIDVFGYVEMDKSREDVPGTWALYSDLSLAPSKWIVLSGNHWEVLYMICGDYPDQSSRVGEIGILSRGTTIPDQEVRHFQQILDTYGLSVTLDEVSHTDCDTVAVL